MNVGTRLVGAPHPGDVRKMHIRVHEDGDFAESNFKTFGCGSEIACSSLATEWVQEYSLDDTASINNFDIAKEFKLSPVKLHCTMLAKDAMKADINDVNWKRKGASATKN